MKSLADSVVAIEIDVQKLSLDFRLGHPELGVVVQAIKQVKRDGSVKDGRNG